MVMFCSRCGKTYESFDGLTLLITDKCKYPRLACRNDRECKPRKIFYNKNGIRIENKLTIK